MATLSSSTLFISMLIIFASVGNIAPIVKGQQREEEEGSSRSTPLIRRTASVAAAARRRELAAAPGEEVAGREGRRREVRPTASTDLISDDVRSVAADSWSIKSEYGSTLDDEQRHADATEALSAASYRAASNYSSDKEDQDAEGVSSMLGFQIYLDSAYADELANARNLANRDGFPDIKFLVDDILETKLDRKFQLVTDKGTLDAIGLHSDGPIKRIMYWDSISKLVAPGGLLVITS
nr:EEF1A lysine methyltransferase 2 [Ipomoea batatas]